MREPVRMLAQWLGLGALVGVLCGAASALFLHLLDAATAFREGHERIVFALPLAGLAIGAIYARYGQAIKAGNNLIIDTIHDDGPELPLRMAPMVLLGTVATHLFGGSAGREGTAVQIGASLSDWLSHRFLLAPELRRQLLAAGVAGGFGSVFGTPIAGAVFGLEFVVLGRIEHRALVPALVASLVGDLTTRALGVVHTPYPQVAPLALSPLVLAKWLVFACAVALVTIGFIELTHFLKRVAERFIPRSPLRLFASGALIVALWLWLGTSDYLGLSIPLMVRAFEDPALPGYAFAAKLAFTALTLGGGFLGGEVTPLFVVGASLGNLLAGWLELPLALAVGVGMASLFGAAANTPLALSIMAVELLGGHAFPHVVIVCALAYVLTGQRSIYAAQRLLQRKADGEVLPRAVALRDLGDPPRPQPPPDPQ